MASCNLRKRPCGRPFAVLGFTVHDDKIVEIDAIVGANRVRRVAVAVLD